MAGRAQGREGPRQGGPKAGRAQGREGSRQGGPSLSCSNPCYQTAMMRSVTLLRCHCLNSALYCPTLGPPSRGQGGASIIMPFSNRNMKLSVMKSPAVSQPGFDLTAHARWADQDLDSLI